MQHSLEIEFRMVCGLPRSSIRRGAWGLRHACLPFLQAGPGPSLEEKRRRKEEVEALERQRRAQLREADPAARSAAEAIRQARARAAAEKAARAAQAQVRPT